MHAQHLAAVIRSPIGNLGLIMEGEGVAELCWLDHGAPRRRPRTDAARIVCAGLEAYFEEAAPCLDYFLNPHGSEFQRRVWSALCNIPLGQCVTYGQLARQLHTSSRAVGQACKTNPITILIPCHRVVSVAGLGGYMGKEKRIHIKEWLLRHEGVVWNSIGLH